MQTKTIKIQLSDSLSTIAKIFPDNIKECLRLSSILYKSIVSEDEKNVIVKHGNSQATFSSLLFYSTLGQVFGVIPERKSDALSCFYKANLYQAILNPDVVKKKRDVFSFRCINKYSLADLINKTITLVSPLKMNDPSDSLIFDWADAKLAFWNKQKTTSHLKGRTMYESLLGCAKIYKESFRKYRIISFCQETQEKSPIHNPLMWSHYSAGHTGYCIKYSLSKSLQAARTESSYLCTRAIVYKKEPVNLISMSDVPGEDLLFAKSHDWSYENEVRMLTYDYKEEKDYVAIPLDSESSINAVYFGVYCRKESEQMIRNILIDDTNIKYYQMEKDYSNIYKLKAMQID